MGKLVHSDKDSAGPLLWSPLLTQTCFPHRSISTVPASSPPEQGDGEFPSSASVSLYGESQRQPVAATKSSEVEMSSLSVSPRVPRIFLLLLLLAKSSLQAEAPECVLTLTHDPQNVVILYLAFFCIKLLEYSIPPHAEQNPPLATVHSGFLHRILIRLLFL